MSRSWKSKTIDIRKDVFNRPTPFSSLINYREKNFNGIDSISHYKTNKRIEYALKTNSYGWRCDEFIDNHKDKKHILFAGCSETWGEGSIIEDCWSHILYNKINKTVSCSGFFSIGIPGGGVDDIFNVVSEYVDEFGLPDNIFLMLPNVPRHSEYLTKEDYSIANSGFYRVGAYTEGETDQPTIGQYTMSEYNTNVIHHYLNIKIFENLLNRTKCNFFWSTWDNEFIQDLKKFNLHGNNFTDTYISPEEAYIEYNNNSNLNMEKPDGHHGTIFHNAWADKFYKEYIKNEQR